MRPLRFSPWATGLVSGLLFSVVAGQGETAIHERGRCAIRGHCGKKSFFGGELPCPDNDLARDPDAALRDKLVDLCGNKWSEGPICCEDEQVGLPGCQAHGQKLTHLGSIGRRVEEEPEVGGRNHRLVSGMQGQLLQYLLHIHMLPQPVPFRQHYTDREEQRRQNPGDRTGQPLVRGIPKRLLRQLQECQEWRIGWKSDRFHRWRREELHSVYEVPR